MKEILENYKKLIEKGANVIVRIPVIEGVNDNIEEMKNIKNFFEKVGFPQKVELLPYHAMGENKYSAIGKTLGVFAVPSSDKMTELKAIF